MQINTRFNSRGIRIVGRIGGWGSLYDAASVAIFAAMSPAPADARKVVIDTFVKALMTAGIWNSIDVLQVYAAHSRQPSLVNWKNPGTFDGTEANGPITFTTDRGFTPNGTTQYIDSGFNPAAATSPHFVQDSAHMGIWVLTSRAGNDDVEIGQSPTGGVNLYPRFTDDNTYMRLNDAIEAEGMPVTDSAGLSVANRSSSTARQGYRNGSSVGTYALNNSQAVINSSILAGAGGNKFGADQIALATIGASLNSGLQSSLYSAALAYLQAVGAVP